MQTEQQNIEAPKILAAVYEGDHVIVTWDAREHSAAVKWMVQLSCLDANQWSSVRRVVLPSQAREGRLTLIEPLNTWVTYQISVQALAADGGCETSKPVVLPTQRPTLQSANYDGQILTVSWQPSPHAAVGYDVIVSSATNGREQIFRASDSWCPASSIHEWRLDISLCSNQQWSVRVAAVAEDNATVRSEPMHFPRGSMAVPLLDSNNLYREGSYISAMWTLADVSDIVECRLTATSRISRVSYSVQGLDPNFWYGDLPLPAPLAEKDSFEFTVTAVTASGAGLVSTPQVILSARPVIESAVLHSQGLELSWRMLSGLAISDYTLQVFSRSSGKTYTRTVQEPWLTRGNIPLEIALDEKQQWLCQVIANSGSGMGTESDLVPLVTGTVELIDQRIEQSSITLFWQPPESVTPPTGTKVEVSMGGRVISSTSVTGNSAQLPLPCPENSSILPTVELTPFNAQAHNKRAIHYTPAETSRPEQLVDRARQSKPLTFRVARPLPWPSVPEAPNGRIVNTQQGATIVVPASAALLYGERVRGRAGIVTTATLSVTLPGKPLGIPVTAAELERLLNTGIQPWFYEVEIGGVWRKSSDIGIWVGAEPGWREENWSNVDIKPLEIGQPIETDSRLIVELRKFAPSGDLRTGFTRDGISTRLSVLHGSLVFITLPDPLPTAFRFFYYPSRDGAVSLKFYSPSGEFLDEALLAPSQLPNPTLFSYMHPQWKAVQYIQLEVLSAYSVQEQHVHIPSFIWD